MRVLCEACARPQPSDWRPGDFCVWCGQAVRREFRCFWCARWTPEGKFCRVCGAATVAPELYGAARMLKDAGTDRFTVPKLLRELETGQVENFTRIFKEHASVADQHVEQRAFLEQHLVQKTWSRALDDTLAAQLPWPLDRLDAMRAAAQRVNGHLEGLAKVRAIQESTPFPETAALAILARLALEDWSAQDDVACLIGSPDPALRLEAALALTHWRAVYGPGVPREVRRQVVDELHNCTLKEEAAVRLALLGESGGVPLPQDDFGAALAMGDVDRLSTAARDGDAMMRFAAAQKLIALGVLAPVGDALRTVTTDQQRELLGLLDRRKKPALELKEALFDVARDTADRRVTLTACTVLCYGCDPAEALRIARAGKGDPQVYQALFQRAALSPESLEELGAWLVTEGAFRAEQWGLADAAKKGRMPANFVPRQWPRADDPARLALCRFAEMQLGECGDDDLHRFLATVALTPSSVPLQSAAWSSLYRWYDSFGFPRRRPLKVSPEAIEFFSGSPRDFLVALTRFLKGHEILRETLQRDHIAELLRYPDPGALPLFAEFPDEKLSLAEATAEISRDESIDLILRLAAKDFLRFLDLP